MYPPLDLDLLLALPPLHSLQGPFGGALRASRGEACSGDLGAGVRQAVES